jgi:hypothetical protein
MVCATSAAGIFKSADSDVGIAASISADQGSERITFV